MSYQTKIYGGGKIAIPADVRKILGISDGDRVNLNIENGLLTIRTREQSLREMHSYFNSVIAPDRILSDELIAERRAEALGE
jgi:AbrB family looped-hinge helix DNA binding protein